MSIAQGVVSGWLKPKRSQSKRPPGLNETELQEILHMPPRLGVGAPIPQSTSALVMRETSRLKTKLEKKRVWLEDEACGEKEGDSGDEESRAGAIHKRAKLDPFTTPNGKKRRKGVAANLHNVKPISSEKSEQDLTQKREGPDATIDGSHPMLLDKLPSSTASVSEKQKGNKPGFLEGVYGADAGASADILKASPGSATVSGTLESAITTSQSKTRAGDSAVTASETTCVSFPTAPSLKLPEKFPIKNQVGSSFVARDDSAEQFQKPQMPLLNLAGPPPDIEPMDGSAALKKKKKRRKKKKKKKKDPIGDLDSEQVKGDDREALSADEKAGA
ncbi:hypothetical protein K488DRAFT_84330 [Vararia minispora EC-137]|uniref:Uncharacterized protein n=1 Tax=Vararia minispora EC-137 TaxID=1314806 RepID=A0ACB8QR71_9AGAM|nr:hypothetical protein K488DRAFT_84330 [Vararia minispora EC-137]